MYKLCFYRSIALKIYYNFIKWNICCSLHSESCLIGTTRSSYVSARNLREKQPDRSRVLLHLCTAPINIINSYRKTIYIDQKNVSRLLFLSEKIALTIVFIRVY